MIVVTISKSLQANLKQTQHFSSSQHPTPYTFLLAVQCQEMSGVRISATAAAAVLGRHEQAAHLGVIVAVSKHMVEEVGDLSCRLGGEDRAQVGEVVDMAARLRKHSC